jgi:hypothetical protein
MLTRPTVAAWLDAYSQAWKSYNPEQIGALFSEDAEYLYGPYHEPIMGSDAIVQSWLQNRDSEGTYEGKYMPMLIEGNTAVANGRSTYYEADGKTFLREFDNIFILSFDDDGRCIRFCEWWMEKPKEGA